MLMHGVRLLLVCSDQTHAVLLLGARYAPPLLLLLKLHAYWDIAPREEDSDTAAVATATAGEVNGRRALALSRAGPKPKGAVVSGSGSGSSSAQRAATTAVHLLGAGAASGFCWPTMNITLD